MSRRLWKSHSFGLRLAAVDTSTVAMLSYDPGLSRVRVSLAAVAAEQPGTTVGLVERSSDLLSWVTVRGGRDVALTEDALPVDDYDFPVGVQAHYRVVAQTPQGDPLHIYRDDITVTLDQPWLKSQRYAFLNRKVTIADYGDVTNATRSGAFTVVGRPDPVVVADVRGSDSYDLQLLTQTQQERDAVDLVLAPGDPVLLQTDGDCDVPDGWYAVADVSKARPSRKTHRRVFTLQLQHVSAPAPALAAVTGTWYGLQRHYSTWQDVIDTYDTWGDVLSRVGDAGDLP